MARICGFMSMKFHCAILDLLRGLSGGTCSCWMMLTGNLSDGARGLKCS